MDDELPDIEVGRYALRSFKLVPQPANQELADRLGYWTDGTCKVWKPISYDRQPEAWLDGTCTAKCLARTSWGILTGNPRHPENEHEVPGEDCTCGIYGSLSYADLIDQFKAETRHMIAVFAAEGATILGDRGLRTAYARVVAYWTSPGFVHRETARVQFKDAQRFDGIPEMLDAHNLAYLPPALPKEAIASRPEWWSRRQK